MVPESGENISFTRIGNGVYEVENAYSGSFDYFKGSSGNNVDREIQNEQTVQPLQNERQG